VTETLPIGWWHRPYATLDFETTGISVEDDRIVQGATGLVHDGQIDMRMWLTNPGIPIPEEASRIHGITDEHVRWSPPAAEVVGEILAVLHRCVNKQIPLAIFNAPYDLTLLDREARRHGHPTLNELAAGDSPSLLVVDPHVIDKEVSKRKGSRTLIATCEFYDLAFPGEAHNAAIDAVMAARLVPVLFERYPELAGLTPVELHQEQIKWKRKQARSLALYFNKTGQRDRAATVSGCWPLVPSPSE
jgi:DNA polymerase-3 subunit epsilon